MASATLLIFQKNKAFEPVAHEATEKARIMATERINTQRGFLFAQCLHNPDLTQFVAEQGELLQISFELQFLWGLFGEHAQQYNLPTDPHSRIKIHLIDWLIAGHGYGMDNAVKEVNETERLFNQCDTLFDAICELGKRSYLEPDETCMVRVYRALMSQRAA